MRAAAACLAAAALCACGSEPAGANSVDSHGWLCSTQPGVVPSVGLKRSTEVFDVALPALEPVDRGAHGLIATADGVVVFTTRARHLVTVDGAVTSFPYDPQFPFQAAMLEGTGRGPGFGAIMEIGSPSRLRFCVFDGDAPATDARCVDVADALEGAILAFDGTHYRAYAVVDGAIHRWTFDDTPSLLASEDLPPSNAIDSAVVAAAASTDAELVMTTSPHAEHPGCDNLNTHVFAAGGNEWTRLLPSDMTSPPGRTPAITTTDDGGFVILSAAACLFLNRQDCNGNGEQHMSFLSTRTTDGVVATIAAPVKTETHSTIFPDGSSTVVFHGGWSQWLFSRLGAQGDLELSDTQLGGSPIDVVYAGLALAPDDYVFVYDKSSPHETRISRVIAPPSP